VCVRAVPARWARTRKARRGHSRALGGPKSGQRDELREVLRSRHRLNGSRWRVTLCIVATFRLFSPRPQLPLYTQKPQLPLDAKCGQRCLQIVAEAATVSPMASRVVLAVLSVDQIRHRAGFLPPSPVWRRCHRAGPAGSIPDVLDGSPPAVTATKDSRYLPSCDAGRHELELLRLALASNTLSGVRTALMISSRSARASSQRVCFSSSSVQLSTRATTLMAAYSSNLGGRSYSTSCADGRRASPSPLRTQSLQPAVLLIAVDSYQVVKPVA
jgi:hypothetical protein